MYLKKEYKNKKVLITGGLGFIGSSIAKQLVEYGADVTILDAELPRYGGNYFNIEPIRRDIKYIKGDIRDVSIIDFLVEDKDIIFNLAGQVDYNYSLKDPFLDSDINCKGHLIVLESCRKHNPDAKIIHAGSRMQYGKIISNPVDETHPTDPLSIYGVHKLTAEKYYLAYHHHYNMKTLCTRLTNPYGPGSQMKHHHYSIVNWFIRLALENQKIEIFGDGKQIRDYVFIEDVTNALIISAINDKTNGQVYNIGSGTPTPFIDMAKTIVDVVGSNKIVMKEWPKNWHNVETGDFYANINKLKRDTGWEPKISLREGIEKTVGYYQNYKEDYW